MLKLIAFYNLFFVYVIMVNKYHQEHKERLQKEPREGYQNLSEEKDKRRKKAQQRYQNFTEEEKTKRRQYY